MSEVAQDTACQHLRHVGGCRVLRCLGSGAMGHVFLAEEETDVAELTAVKVLPLHLAADSEYRARFNREALALTGLDTPHVPRLLRLGIEQGRPFLVMDFVPGVNLREWLRQHQRMTEHDARILLTHLAIALDQCHRRGLVHRDVKPANVLIGPARPGYAETFCAKLCDFGLCGLRHEVEREASSSNLGHSSAVTGDISRTGFAIGSPHYMSPEAAQGLRTKPASDLYSLGATLHAALTGQTVFNGADSAEIMQHQVCRPFDAARLRQLRISDQLISLLASMLDKEPLRRPASARDILGQLGPY